MLLKYLPNFVGFILPAIAITGTLLHIGILVGETSFKRTNTLPKILIFSALPLFVFILLLNNILYELSSDMNLCENLLVAIIGLYIVAETVMKNSVISGIIKYYREENRIKEMPKCDERSEQLKCIREKERRIIETYEKSWFNKYWVLTILFNIIIMGIAGYNAIDHHELTVFNQNVILFSFIVILIKYKTISILHNRPDSIHNQNKKKTND